MCGVVYDGVDHWGGQQQGAKRCCQCPGDFSEIILCSLLECYLAPKQRTLVSFFQHRNGNFFFLERCTNISTGRRPTCNIMLIQTNKLRASNNLSLWSLHVPNTVWDVWQDESDSTCFDLTLGLRSTEPARHHTCPNHTDTYLVSHRAPPPILPWASKIKKFSGVQLEKTKMNQSENLNWDYFIA